MPSASHEDETVSQKRPSQAHPSPVAAEPATVPLTVALAGNPNSGKTSIFNALTGAHQHVGNWGGVTVELKEGTARLGAHQVTVVDLPGTYSLSAYSLEERVARDYLVEAHPDVVVQVVDATNLERHLYLTVQLLELGVRPVLALNMWDEVRRKGLKIDVDALAHILHLPVVTTVGRTAEGIDGMLEAAVRHGRDGDTHFDRLPAPFAKEVQRAIHTLTADERLSRLGRYPAHWVAAKLLENDTQVREMLAGHRDLLEQVDGLEAQVERITGQDTETLIAEGRYGFIAGAVRQTVTKPGVSRIELSDRIDRVLTHPVLAYPVFLLFMWLLFQATFKLGEYPAALLDMLFGWIGNSAEAALPPGDLRDLIVEGVVKGVGSVASFLPNILILFFGISIMEDTGYMARAAFIMDKFMHSIGLHGKSFVPVIMGMGCTVPAIMAARTLESPRDRIKTILLTPLISCSARLPVYVLFAGSLFPRHAGAIVFLFNFVFGLTAFFGMGLLFHKTLFRGEDYPFVMELPPYRFPTMRSVIIHMWQKARHYLKKMGGVVLLFTVIVWALGSFPKAPELRNEYEQRIEQVQTDGDMSPAEKTERVVQLRREHEATFMRQTYIGRLGQFLEPAVSPLGFDWQAAVSLVTGFVAKEVVVSSLGVLYGAGDEADEESAGLQNHIRAHFTPLSGFAFMLFVLLYTPCIVAFFTIVRELRNWRWSLFSVTYQIAFAWLAAFVVYQGGRLLGLV